MMSASPRLVSPVKLSALLHDIAEVRGQDDREITGMSLDSRNASQGDLFFACAGQDSHGMEFFEDVVKAGVAAVALEPTNDSSWDDKVSSNIQDEQRVPVYRIDDLKGLIGVIADRFYGHPSRNVCVIGITGTNGKTSCSHFLAKSLDSSSGKVKSRCGVIGTLGYGLYSNLHAASHTTPDAIRVHSLLSEMYQQDAGHVVLEVSSHALDQGRVNGVEFDIAVFTNLSRDHLDYHEDITSYAAAKKRLFDFPGLKAAVINSDDVVGRELLAGLSESVDAVAYGFSSQKDLQSGTGKYECVLGSELELNKNGLSFHVTSPWGEGKISSQLLGEFNASNILAVLSVLLKLGFSFEQVQEQAMSLTTVSGRMERISVSELLPRSQPLVVIDYAHTPDALEHVLMALRGHGDGKLVCVFGCGGDRDKGKRPLMGAVAEKYSDQVILTDDNPRTESSQKIIEDVLSGINDSSSVIVEQDRAKAITRAIQNAHQDDVVLVAGKGHEEYQLKGDRKIPFSDHDEVRRCLEVSAS